MYTELVEGIRQKSNKGITNTLEDAFKTTSSMIYADMSYRLKSGLNMDPLEHGHYQPRGRPEDVEERLPEQLYRHPYAG